MPCRITMLASAHVPVMSSIACFLDSKQSGLKKSTDCTLSGVNQQPVPSLHFSCHLKTSTFNILIGVIFSLNSHGEQLLALFEISWFTIKVRC